MSELEACRCEGRNYNSELYRLKAAHDEVVEQLDVVKRENKNLADEIKDLLDQLGDGGRSIHELDKQMRRPRVPSSRRRTRSSAPLWSSARSARRSTAGSPRRKRSSRTAARTTPVPWTPCRPASSPSSAPRPRR